MLIPVAREAFLPLVVISFLAGIGFGIVYDLFRIRRAAFRLPHTPPTHKTGLFFYRHGTVIDTVLIVFEDVLFSLFVAIAMILVTFKLYFGVPRWFAYAAAAGGFALYHVTVGRLVMRSVSLLFSLIRAIGKRIVRYLLAPVANLCRRGMSAWYRSCNRRHRRLQTKRHETQILAAVCRITQRNRS